MGGVEGRKYLEEGRDGRVQCCRARKAGEGAALGSTGGPGGFDQSSHHLGEEAAPGLGGLRAGSGWRGYTRERGFW